ncbi:MAG: hypothetical protein MUC58_01640 [Rhizobiaceae bacterium]|jgi:hypothetical protein|nr:hypothetical protein [Rhizobiaceae bacterium]
MRLARETVLITALLALAACTPDAALDPLEVAPPRTDLAFPEINVVPRGEVAQMTPEEEIALLTALNAELEAKSVLTPAERALFEQRKRRLLQLARSNTAAVNAEIEARN